MNYYTDALKKYADFSGRATRTQFWMFALLNFVAMIVVGIVAGIIHFGLLALLYWLAVLVPTWALGVRRLHDTGRSGWWILIGFVPFIGGLILIVFACLDSVPDNQYGPNPKGMMNAMPSQLPPTTPTV